MLKQNESNRTVVIEVGASFLANLPQTPIEIAEQFQQRQARARDAFITAVLIKGFNDETVTGHGESLFDSPLLPERIYSVTVCRPSPRQTTVIGS
jgi:hypothetical protein